MNSERTIQSLNQVPLFNLFDSGEKGFLAARARERSFRMGESIVDEFNQGEAFYIVISGQARKIGISNEEEKNLGLLHPGEHFGENALFGGGSSPSVIHVRASTDLQVLELSGPNFRQVIGLHPQLEKQLKEYIASDVIRAFLKNSTVFTHADHSAIRSLLTCLEVCEYSSSEYLVREGEKGESFFILESGVATVERGTDVVNRLYPGDFFGEIALLTGGPRKASVRAVEPVRAYRLDKMDFDRLITEFPVILESIRRISDHYSAEAMNIPALHGLIAGADGAEVSAAAEIPLPSQERSSIRRGLGSWKRWRRSPTPALLQQSEMDCGPTCLTMIARYYGMNAGVNRMRERCNVGTEGTSMLMLVKTAESLGFEAQGIKATPVNLQELAGPLILHWDGNHYIVVYEVRDQDLVIVDPTVGYVETVPLSYVLEHWTGFVITLKPTDLLADLDDRERFWSRYIDYFRPYRKLFGSSLALAIILELGLLAFPIATQQIFDRVLNTEGISLLNELFIGLLLFVLVIAGGTAVRQLLVGRLAYRIDSVMLNGFYKHLFMLPYTYFVKRTSGDIITRVFENEKIRRLLTDHGFLLLLDGVSIVVYGILMFYYQAQLALITFAVLPLYMLLYGNLLPLMRRNVRKLSIAAGESHTQIVETIGAIATVKAASAEQRVRSKLEEKLRKQLALSYEGNKLEIVATTGSLFIRSLCHIVLLYCGARLVISGQLSLGEFVAFTVMFTSFLFSLESISRLFGEWSEARISMERLNDVYESTVEHPYPDSMRILPRIQGHLRFDNVSFAYGQGSKPVLHNVSVELIPGLNVALVGRSGSGKSTIANLLLKLFEPTQGGIYIDGYPLRQVYADSIRKQVGYVQQETVMFRGTIEENIAFNSESVSLEDIERVSKQAGAHDFVEQLPLGYQTVVGEGGMRLSGGQKQRIAIARALLGNPRILIFDEATSALDTESERIIQQNMEAIVKDRTTLIIAHRLSTIRRADLILVLDKGAIAERGTHEELLRKRGLYYYLVHQQTEG